MVRYETGTVRRLLIVAECEHGRREGRVVCPEHFRTEIDQWARYVDSVRLLTNFPPSFETAPASWGSYQADNIEVLEAQGAFSKQPLERLRSLRRSARSLGRIAAGFRWADAVHVRGPCRNAFLATLVARAVPRPIFFKWSAQWAGPKRWSMAARMQRRFVMNRGWKIAATVYDHRLEDPPWVFVTDTTSLSEKQVRQALAVRREEPGGGPVELLWVGRFTPNKNVSELLLLIRDLANECGKRRVVLHLVGDGPLREPLEELTRDLGLIHSVVFHGSLGWADLSRRYASARILLLPSGTEGFPKVVHESLLFGTPVVAYAVGAIPRMLEGRGEAVPPVDGPRGFFEAVKRVLFQEDLWNEYSENGRRWAREISIEKVVARHVATCERQWAASFSRISPLEDGVRPWGANGG